jgi:hypothetical protein
MSKLFLVNINANAVGAGVGVSIGKMQRGRELETPEAWVHFCCTAAEEAYQAAMDDPILTPELHLDVMQQGKGESTPAFLLRTLEKEPKPFEQLDVAAMEAAAHEAAGVAFRMCMPRLVGRRTTQAFIACVAVGVQRGYILGRDAKSLLYTAQLALSAHPKRESSPRRKRRGAGFDTPPPPNAKEQS